MFRSFAAGFLFIAATVFTLPVQAQNTSGSEEVLPPITEQHLELAHQVFVASDTGQSFDHILPTIADQAKSTFIRSNPQIQLGVINAVDKVALEMVPLRKELNDGLIKVWARAFTEDELSALLQFFQSPVGQKFNENYPKLISTQLALAENWTGQISNELTRRVQIELTNMVKEDAQSLRGTTSESTGQ